MSQLKLISTRVNKSDSSDSFWQPYLPPLVDREHDGEGEREVRRDVEEVGPLVEGLLHHGVLLVVQPHYRLLEVPHAPVDQLRAPEKGAKFNLFISNLFIY